MAFLHTIQTQRTDVNERYGTTKDPSPLRGFKTPAPVLISLSYAQKKTLLDITFILFIFLDISEFFSRIF